MIATNDWIKLLHNRLHKCLSVISINEIGFTHILLILSVSKLLINGLILESLSKRDQMFDKTTYFNKKSIYLYLQQIPKAYLWVQLILTIANCWATIKLLQILYVLKFYFNNLCEDFSKSYF